MIDVTIPSQVNENADIKGKRKEYIILRYSVFTIWQADTQLQRFARPRSGNPPVLWRGEAVAAPGNRPTWSRT